MKNKGKTQRKCTAAADLLGVETETTRQLSLTIRRNALYPMSPEEKSMIHDTTLDSASLFQDPNLASLNHYVSSRDPVTFLSPIQRFNRALNTHLRPSMGNSLFEYSVLGPTYKPQLQFVCKDAVKHF